VISAPRTLGSQAGDLVVGIVRRPDPVPCPACGRGEFDMCRNGPIHRAGIKEIHGYGSQRWTVEADYAVSSTHAGEIPAVSGPAPPEPTHGCRSARCGPRPWRRPWPVPADPDALQRGVEPNRVVGLDGPALRAVPVYSLIPRSVYRPLRHMSNSPRPQAGRAPGRGAGRCRPRGRPLRTQCPAER